VIRHHRLLELYLSQALGLSLDAVHSEADRLEHALSEELEERIDRSLGYPTHDPHGDPIPDAKLRIERGRLRTLASLEPGDVATIRRVPDDDDALLRYLADHALVPGKTVTLTRAEPFGGPLILRVGKAEHAISRELAEGIGVT